jgi:hypothetical protein
MEIDLQPITHYSAPQIQSYLRISPRRLRRYCQLLRESCPDEFTHPQYSTLYSVESYFALKKVRKMFLMGATENQVKNTLKLEGI